MLTRTTTNTKHVTWPSSKQEATHRRSGECNPPATCNAFKLLLWGVSSNYSGAIVVQRRSLVNAVVIIVLVVVVAVIRYYKSARLRHRVPCVSKGVLELLLVEQATHVRKRLSTEVWAICLKEECVPSSGELVRGRNIEPSSAEQFRNNKFRKHDMRN